MIAVDTNILVYAHRVDSLWNGVAWPLLQTLSKGRTTWAIPWPCIHEFLCVVTHAKIYAPATTMDEALHQVSAWLESPKVTLIAENELHWPSLRSQLSTARVTGAMVHDARIAALCVSHGVTEFWTADRDFSRFPDLACRNPLL